MEQEDIEEEEEERKTEEDAPLPIIGRNRINTENESGSHILASASYVTGCLKVDSESNERVQLNTINDLSKMTFLQIKNLPLSKCKGDVFEAALRQAIELEKGGGRS